MSITNTFSRYSNFNGRASRSEYWGVMLVSLVLLFVAWTLGFMFIAFGSFWAGFGGIVLFAGLVGWLWLGIATTVRRCHDAQINPWFTMATVLPYVGWIVIVVLGCLESKE